MTSPIDPITKTQALALTLAAHWADEAGSHPDHDDSLASDTAEVAWLAYQALAALAGHDHAAAEHLARQIEGCALDIGDLARHTLERHTTDPRWDHQPLSNHLTQEVA
ncbi:hypothetical protein [Streptomyces sp. URMC 123]|uniref:hypothetical protein n=1 Tax=Streptomyces sp. URMC 123 TaxID=3423403 RepID=UPI003F1C2E1F